ncbi:acetoacetate decarboxylase [Flexivirga sp. ID2601S]|uniref:Acetoacetate decarboxylase n=1 Tax=Flexivirga aerilata TaxID=1656889 RepID=A0A849AJP2_9MICO|nr:acetoacetate decarboxylase family protein [Flexivirga aerilata]NNG39541.1 acetoacetate decarboxylase [Flexivirga aerilata]
MDTVDVTLGTHTVPVPKGGYYDRFRMNSDLDEVARDPRVSDVSFFRSIPKTVVESPIGTTLTPNFYYRNSTARLTYLAKTGAIRSRLPRELDPLEVAPGIGLAFVMFFRYDVADIDFYTEAAVGAAVRPARHGHVGFADLATALGNNHLYAYVMSLPVNTQIAQVRGHDGYGFPKWVTELDVDIDAARTSARVANDTGGTDIALTARTPKQKHYPSGSKVGSLTSYTQIGDDWFSTLSQTNVLASGVQLLPRKVDVELGNGRVSDDLRSLETIRPLQFEVATEVQIALHLPAPISVATRS